MVKYGFFNAKKLMTGDYDRKYNADDVNAYFKGAISQDGIYQFVGNQCRVIPAGNMNVAVRDGKGQINYHWFEVTANEVLTIREAHATLNRWTAIVARYDAANRNIYLLTVDGSESERPTKPLMQKTDVLRDICLAYVYVAAGATEITRADIEDTVEDIEVCGFVSTLLAGTGGVKKVHQLPIPSRTCQGDIYYLIEESKTAGRTYEKGYYYCEPSRTEYDYVDFDWTSDTLANRPIASEDYLEVLFFANDNNKWYRCVEVSENTYEWQEVIVNEVEELPEPTEEINNYFYIIGNTLYKVAKQESNYKWYMFGTGGGGGHGDFAIIRIEYPEGTEVQVTFDGDTVDAPDTSGVWIYGCDAAGIYAVGIKNTSVVKNVEITEAGQVENIFVSPQTINYALIYYLGNEFAEPTDEEKAYAIKTGGWGNLVKTSECLEDPFNLASISTNTNVDLTGFNNFMFYYRGFNPTNTSVNQSFYFSYGMRSGLKLTTTISPNNFSVEKVSSTTSRMSANIRGFLCANKVLGNAKISLNIEVSSYQHSFVNTSDFGKQNIYICSCGLTGSSGESSCAKVKIYCMGAYKTDDISGLSNYGSTISEILSNSTSLFDDASALQWMVLNCTGDFMISALSNSNFINVMNTSQNRTILTANEHWARFIALLSV